MAKKSAGMEEEREYDPSIEPENAHAWLNLIEDAEKVFERYQSSADRVDKKYADLTKLASDTRSREFQLFWANVQVLGPSVYSRPPVPVVAPKFKDRRPLYQIASEVLERCAVVSFDLGDIDQVMKLLRDDLNVQARGVAWVRYDTERGGDYGEKVCYEHIDRKDFLHDPARNWSEVGWVARRAWMTRSEMKERFSRYSGDAYLMANFAKRKQDDGGANPREKAGVWEIWSKTEERVVWVTEGVEEVLDAGKPHLKLEGFFPCPRPAYGTLERRSLVPVPDMAFYKDQLEEINELTGRIHALSDAVKVRGFYPAGAGEIGDAIQSAYNSLDDRQVMVPISNWAAFGNGSAKDTIVWLPIDMIVETIAQLVELRRVVIEDVYQIVGISDIMRGQADTGGTKTATEQSLKAQYGSVRIRDKIAELVRIARDLVRIGAEVMAENFDRKTMLAMSQMDVPSDAAVKKQIAEAQAAAQQQLNDLARQLAQDPEGPQKLQQAQQQIGEQLSAQVAELEQTVTIEQVMKFLRDERLRPFVLDIETDSTIQPDEDAEKQRRSEFLQVMGGTIQQLGALVQQQPAAAPFAAEVLKFALAPYRAGRELDSAVEEFADQMQQVANQPQANPEAEKAQAELQMMQEKHQFEMQEKQAEGEQRAQQAGEEMRARQQEAQIRLQEAQAKLGEINARMEQAAQKHQQDMARGALDIRKAEQDMAIKAAGAAMDAESKEQDAEIRREDADRKARESEAA